MASPILQADPGAGQRECLDEIEAAVRDVLLGNRFILGPRTMEFEHAFAEYLTVDRVAGVGTGTDAIHLALRALGIGRGDEVITVSHTAVATVAAIARTGARPVLVDVDPRTFTMDPSVLPDALTHRTRAIVPVHLYGQPADMAAILAFARAHDLRVVEDCAQCHGACWRSSDDGTWTRAGAASDAAAFSFYPTKNLGGIGDGGCVATRNPEVAETVRRLREYGWKDRFVSERPGWNSRLDEVQAAVLLVKLRRLDAWNAARVDRAGLYDRQLADLDLTVPHRAPDRTHVFHQYVIRVRDRDRIRRDLAHAGVGTAVHYPVPVHLQPAYRRLAPRGSLPVTERLAREILSLPMHPHLVPADLDRTVRELRRVMSGA